MQRKEGINMTWDFIISAKNKYLKRKSIKILLLGLFLLLLFMLIFLYKRHDMCEVDSETRYKFESLIRKPSWEILSILVEPDKWEGCGNPYPVYVLDNDLEVELIFLYGSDLEQGSMLWRIVYEKDGKIIRDVRTKIK